MQGSHSRLFVLAAAVFLALSLFAGTMPAAAKRDGCTWVSLNGVWWWAITGKGCTIQTWLRAEGDIRVWYSLDSLENEDWRAGSHVVVEILNRWDQASTRESKSILRQVGDESTPTLVLTGQDYNVIFTFFNLVGRLFRPLVHTSPA